MHVHAGTRQCGLQPTKRRGGRTRRREILRQQLEEPRRRRMEGHVGTRQLNPTDAEDAPDESVVTSDPEQISQEPEDSPPEVAAEGLPEDVVDRRPPRLGRGWVAGICAGLVLLTVAAGAGGILLIKDNRRSEAIARDNAAALQAAKDCVAATQAPDTAAMSQAQL